MRSLHCSFLLAVGTDKEAPSCNANQWRGRSCGLIVLRFFLLLSFRGINMTNLFMQMQVCRCFCAFFFLNLRPRLLSSTGKEKKALWARGDDECREADGEITSQFVYLSSSAGVNGEKGASLWQEAPRFKAEKILIKPILLIVPLWVFDLMLYWCLNMLQVAPLINLYQTSSGTLTLNILIYRSVWRW